MFFVLSKIFWFLFAPASLVAWAAIATAVLLFLGRPKSAKWCATVSAALFILIGVCPTGLWALGPLENRFQPGSLPERIDGIVVLGGGLGADVLPTGNGERTNVNLARLVGVAVLAKRYPGARIIFSGASSEREGLDSEATAAKRLLSELGVDSNRVVLETASRNTRENLVNSKTIARPGKDNVWILASSASQLPRAMGVAARLKWRMIAYPTDYSGSHGGSLGFFNIPDNFRMADRAFREWFGYAVYRISGKASASH